MSFSKEQILAAQWPKAKVYNLSRFVCIAVFVLAIGSYFWQPEGALEWTLDILFRTWITFIGMVMAHDGTHGLLGKSNQANAWWGRLALIPCTVPYWIFKRAHLHHHANTNTPDKDPDCFLKPNRWYEVSFRALGMNHNWLVWLTKKGKVSRANWIEWIVHYIFIFAFYITIGSLVGYERAAWGLFGTLFVVSHVLWYPFAYYTHEGYSVGDQEERSHNYYGWGMYWFSFGLSMHRVHHQHQQLAWMEMMPFVRPNPNGWPRALLPQLDKITLNPK